MKKLLLVLAIFLSACSTVVPIKQNFPTLPEELTKTCKPLETIEGVTTTLSKLMETVARNYGTRHECALQLESLLEWYNEQKKIFDEMNSD
jgi:coenzyme F420-reducing hydrogenase alpha subunit